MHELAFVFAGCVVGLIAGHAEVGRGSLMTRPVFGFGVKPYLAMGA